VPTNCRASHVAKPAGREAEAGRGEEAEEQPEQRGSGPGHHSPTSIYSWSHRISESFPRLQGAGRVRHRPAPTFRRLSVRRIRARIHGREFPDDFSYRRVPHLHPARSLTFREAVPRRRRGLQLSVQFHLAPPLHTHSRQDQDQPDAYHNNRLHCPHPSPRKARGVIAEWGGNGSP
jgi:hypothetical protein